MLAPAILCFSFTAVSVHGLTLLGSVQVNTGIEYDSNANRAPSDGSLGIDEVPRGGPLFRGLLRGELAYLGTRQLMRLQLQAGGKIFLLPTLQDQNVGVVAASYDHSAQVGRVRLGGALDYYDAYQAPAAPLDSRAFLSLSGLLRMTGTRPLGKKELHRMDGGLDLGGLLFMFKPNHSYNYLGPTLAARFGTSLHAGDPELGHDFNLGLQLRVDYRSYLNYLSASSGRNDVFIQAGAHLTWQGPLLAQLGYSAQLVLANLDEESYKRHLLLGKIAFRIPGDLYVTLKTQISLLQGVRGLSNPIISNIDDDYHSMVLFDVERPLPHGFAFLIRYTGYFSLPAESIPLYQRHTACLGASYTWKRKRKGEG